MKPIISKPPSKAYDEFCERAFGNKTPEPEQTPPEEPGDDVQSARLRIAKGELRPPGH
jgi:hypothetical protein